MKHTKLAAILLSVLMLLGMFGCTATKVEESTAPVSTATEAPAASTEEPKETATEEPKAEATEEPKAEPEATAEPAAEPETEETKPEAGEKVRVAALVGPTGMGLAYLSKNTEAYQLDLYTAPDQITAKVINGEVDIAAVPVNLGSVLYNKTQGGVTAIAVNTLGVLYFVENGDTVHAVSDLAGKTVYSTGQGSTPQYILEKILADNGLTDQVQVEYLAENTELVAKLLEGKDVTLAFLPEPMVSNAVMKGETCRVALSANELWEGANETSIVQGIYIVRSAYLAEHKDLVDQFLKDAAESANLVVTAEDAAKVVVEAGIIPAEPIAKRAIPNANIVLETGESMENLVKSMLETLFAVDPKAVGGKLPEADFYYAGN